jgi:hypothetical protein
MPAPARVPDHRDQGMRFTRARPGVTRRTGAAGPDRDGLPWGPCVRSLGWAGRTEGSA